MTRFVFFVGEDWVNSEKVTEVEAPASVSVGDVVEVRHKGDLRVSDVVHALKHVFNGPEYWVEVLIFERGPSVYETRGIRMI